MNATKTVDRIAERQQLGPAPSQHKNPIIQFKSRRDLDVDALKGLAILLVVLGHTIQGYAPDFDHNIVFRTIYSFHMPLFMFLSGYIAFNRPINLGQKFKTLVIPFLSWYLIWYFVAGVYKSTAFIDYVIHLYKPPDDRLWFLWILFLNFWILEACLTCLLPKEVTILLAVLATKFIPGEVLDIPLLRWYFLFFAVGYLIAGHRNLLLPLKRPLQVIAVVAFPVLVSSWFRVDEPSFLPALRQIVDSYNPLEADLVLWVYDLMVPLLGISLAFALIAGLRKYSLYGVLAWLGLWTLDIYVSHQVFLFALRVSFGEGMVRFASASILALALSLILAVFLRRMRVLNFLFLGARQAKIPGFSLQPKQTLSHIYVREN